jgi:hypothetical protein
MARRAGVSPAAVTKACNSILKPACVGKRIDVGHAVAVEYIERNTRANEPAAATGLDNLYEDVIEKCQSDGNYTSARIQRDFKIGHVRAGKILTVMRTNGLVPEKGKPIVAQEPKPKPHVRGNEKLLQEKKARLTESFNEFISSRPEQPVSEYAPPEIPEHLGKLADWTIRDVIHRFGTEGAFIDWLKATKEIEIIEEKRLKNAQQRGEVISRQVVKNGMVDTLDGAFKRMLTDGSKTIATRCDTLSKTGITVQELEDVVSKVLTTFIKPTKSKIARVLRNA